MKAMQIASPGAEFELVERAIPEPGANEVLIKVQACGICHGDAVTKEGHFPGIHYPRVPGHEVVGTVAKSGAGAARWRVGQRVGVGWYGGPCLNCEACLMGDLAHCVHPLTTGISFDGGYAEYMTAPAQALASIPEELDSLEAAPLLCAGRTTFSALRHSQARGGDLVAIHGLGGLGHLGLQFAKKLGFRTVALSRGKEKEAAARRLGADAYIDTSATRAADELGKLGGAKVILATAPNSKAIAELVSGLSPDGQLIIVAASPEPMMIPPVLLLGGRRSIKGWVAHPGRSLEDTLRFSVDCGVQPMIEVFPLERVAVAFERMMTSKVQFRSVLKIAD